MNQPTHNTNTQDSMATSIRLGAIAFVNTIPIYSALHESDDYELSYAPPATLNHMIRHHALDVSPVSSAYYLKHKDELVLLDNLSVSSTGAVESVLFLSRNPMESTDFLEQQSTIPVPDDSETSVNLLAWLLQQKTGQDLRHRFKIMPANDYRQTLTEYGSALVIGDNALRIHETPGILNDYHIYDLSGEWVSKTNLPFVFAVWVARKAWAHQNPEQLNQINALLVESRQQFFADATTFRQGIEDAKQRCEIPEAMLEHYFTNALTYTLEAAHYQSLKEFSNILSNFAHPSPHLADIK